jgi:hypothetical protein
MDHAVKIWDLAPLEDIIAKSYDFDELKERRPFPTSFVQVPFFSTSQASARSHLALVSLYVTHYLHVHCPLITLISVKIRFVIQHSIPQRSSLSP